MGRRTRLMIKGMEDVVRLRDPIAAQRAEGVKSGIQMSRDIIELAVAARRDSMNVIIPVTFRFPGSLSPHARQVSVAGSFNEWDPTTHTLVRTSVGDWATTLALPAGLVVYCFYVDGVPWLDPHDEGRIPNEWGTELSSRMVRWDSGITESDIRKSIPCAADVRRFYDSSPRKVWRTASTAVSQRWLSISPLCESVRGP